MTIPALLEAAADDAPSRTWLRFGDRAWTYAQAHERISSIAAALDVQRGTRVLITMPNSPEALFVWLALMWRGAMVLPVNPASTGAERAGFRVQFDPELVIDDPAIYGEVPSSPPPPIAASADDVAVLIPTSGTTGRSKLVMQTQRAYAMAGEGFPWWLGLTSDDVLMTSLPLFHINAPAYSVLGSLAARAGLVLLPRFSGSRFLDDARRYGATEFNAIGAMVEILMRQPERDDDADNPIRICYTGPAPAKERQLEIERRFGWEIISGYALSETPYGLVWKRGTRPYGTLGSPRQHPVLGEINQARVTDDGELELRNPAVMKGYYGMPDETRAVLGEDGWLRTGDLVTANPDGTYTFVGRRKEVIRRRGENLAPGEVEAALEAHPSVVEAAVVGVPSELSEEDVKAFVVLAQPVTTDELREFVAGRIARYKVPRYVEVVTELPHTPTGRIAKHLLSREVEPA
jgi:crotonobetaine/carnitine-CoA ligase